MDWEIESVRLSIYSELEMGCGNECPDTLVEELLLGLLVIIYPLGSLGDRRWRIIMHFGKSFFFSVMALAKPSCRDLFKCFLVRILVSVVQKLKNSFPSDQMRRFAPLQLYWSLGRPLGNYNWVQWRVLWFVVNSDDTGMARFQKDIWMSWRLLPP